MKKGSARTDQFLNELRKGKLYATFSPCTLATSYEEVSGNMFYDNFYSIACNLFALKVPQKGRGYRKEIDFLAIICLDHFVNENSLKPTCFLHEICTEFSSIS